MWRSVSHYFFILALVAVLPQQIVHADVVGPYDGHRDQQNIVECINGSNVAGEFEFSLQNNDRKTRKTLTFNFPAKSSKHFVLDEYGIRNSYGTYKLTQLAPAEPLRVACHTAIYRLNTRVEKTVEYAVSLPQHDVRMGKSYGIYNSLSPDGEFSSNWLAVYNGGTKPFSARVNFYTHEGKLDSANSFDVLNLPAGRRQDFPMGFSRSTRIGLYEIVPFDTELPYIAYTTRFAVTLGDYKYTIPLNATPGSCNPGPIAISSMDDMTNWIEVANRGDATQRILLEAWDSIGKSVHREVFELRAKAQRHILASAFLEKHSTGSLQLRCLDVTREMSGIVVNALHYGKSGGEDVEWAYAAQPRQRPVGADDVVIAFVNTFLSAANWYKEINAGAQELSLEQPFFTGPGVLTAEQQISLRGHASIDLALHQVLGPDAHGLSLLSSTGSAQHVAEVLRVYPRHDGRIGAIMRTPVAVFPSN